MLPSHRRRDIPSGVRGAMISQVLHCPYCNETDIVRHGMSPEGKQRYRCRQCLEGRGRTVLLEYSYAGQSPAVKQQIVDRAMNARGIRDTARVLHVSPTTMINELTNNGPPKSSCSIVPMAGMIVAKYIPGEEGTTIAYRWPDETVFSRL